MSSDNVNIEGDDRNAVALLQVWKSDFTHFLCEVKYHISFIK